MTDHYAVRDGKTFHTRRDCPAYKRWWYRMQMLISTSGLRKCKYCARLDQPDPR